MIIGREMFQKLVSALVSPCGNQTCESRMCGVRNNKLQLSNRSAVPNYTHQNLQSEAAKPLQLRPLLTGSGSPPSLGCV